MILMKLTLVRLAIFLLNPWIVYPVAGLIFLLLARAFHNFMIMDLWDRGRCPDLWDFGIVDKEVKEGEKITYRLYRVKMLPRWLFFWFRNVKWITTDGRGVNVAYGRRSWGRFRIDGEGGGPVMTLASAYGILDSLCLNYGVHDPAQKWPFRIIRDFVREIEEGVFLGRFTITIWGRLLFVFWFLLIDTKELRYAARGKDTDGD